MSISGTNTILNQFTPAFILKSLRDGHVLSFDLARRAFVNREPSELGVGSQVITLSGDASGVGTDSIPVTLSDTGVTPGEYHSVTVDSKGRVCGGVNHTTLLEYGITDAQPLNQNLSDIGAISGSGFLTRSALGGWTLDPGVYLTGNQTITFSGDVSGSGETSVNLTLTDTGVVPGTFNDSATSVTPLDVDSKGRVTGVGQPVVITPDFASITGLPSTLDGYGITDAQPLSPDLSFISGLAGTNGLLRKTALETWALDTTTYLTGNQTITFSGDVSGSGATSVSLVLSDTGVTAGTYNNSATSVSSFTVDSKGRVTGVGPWVTITPAFSSITGKPTTLSGYGISDAQPLDADLTSIAGLNGATGFLQKTAANTWSVRPIHEVPAGGSTGQVLSKTSATDYDLSWVDRTNASAITASVRNVGSVTLPKGTPVYSTGGVTGFSLDVDAADASDPAKMPAVGVLGETLTQHSVGQMLILGEILGVNTTAYAPGTEVYVAEGGGWRSGPPANAEVQFLGIVTRQGSNGGGYITGTGRAETFIWNGTNFSGWNGSSWASLALQSGLDGKQPTLVSGTNIKTINGASILGSGNVSTRFTVTFTALSKTLVEHEHVTVTAADQTISLPASPVAGDEVCVTVGSFTNTVLSRNGSTIQGLAQDLTLSTANSTTSLRYTDTWRII